MSSENINQPLILGAILLKASQFVAAGAECPRWGRLKRRDGALTFLAGIDQVFCQGADNAVSPGNDLADLPAVP